MNGVAIVTGSSSGFGRAIVSGLLADGWTVVATLRRLEERRTLFAADALKAPGRLHLFEMDVTYPESRKALAQFIQSHFEGRLDVLVNNAGQGALGPFELTSEQDLRALMELNFFAPALLTKELLPLLRATRGRVINMSSIMGRVALPLNSVYCASKFAMEGWAESLALELAQTGVRVCNVEPGAYRTSFATNMMGMDSETVAATAYAGLYRGFTKALARKLAQPGKSPDAVAARVVRLCSRTNLPSRVVMGSDAQGLRFFDKFLSKNTRMRVLSAMVRKISSRNQNAENSL